MNNLPSSEPDRSSARGLLRRVFCRYLLKQDGLHGGLAWLLLLADYWEQVRGALGGSRSDWVSAGLRSRVIDRVRPRVLQVSYRRMIREELIQHLRKRRAFTRPSDGSNTGRIDGTEKKSRRTVK